MRILRSLFFTTVLIAAPASSLFAQGAPPKSTSAPKASSAPTSAPTAAPSTKATSAPTSAPAPAQHEIQTEVDAAMNEKAQALFKEGNQRFRDAKYADAAASYKAAWALDLRNQRIVNNLGMTELELHQYRDAAEHLTIALRLAEANDPKRPKIQSSLDEARAKVAAITFKLNTDGVELVHMELGKSYQAPLADPVFVDPGPSSFRIRREGFVSQEKVFNLKAGEQTTADIALERGAGYGGPVTTATAATSGAPTVEPRSKVPAYILGGAGVVGLIVGGVLVGVASSQQDQIWSELPVDAKGPLCGRVAVAGEHAKCADLRTRADSVNLLGNTGIGVLIGGGVLAAAGVVYYFLPNKKASDAKSASVVPTVGREGGGLLVTGSF